MVSSKGAQSKSSQQKLDFSLSGRYLGFKASANYDQTNKSQTTESDGTISAKMTYSNSGAYIQIITGGFSDPDNFTPYLIGTALDAATIKSYVDYTQSYVSGSSGDMYISSLNITNNDKASDGQLLDTSNLYGNIKLLGEMENIFSLLKSQYATYTDTTIRTTLLSNMVQLKGLIRNVIKQFYANNGDSMVIRIGAMNNAIATGQLTFDQHTGNSENTYAAGLSVKYSCLGFGASGSSDVAEARQNGWATATKNMAVTAQSFPAGVIDTTAWAQSIVTKLNNESAPISVPALNLPTLATATRPDPPPVEKDPAAPPDSCFTSYQQWQDYQNSLKKGGGNQDQKKQDENQQNVQNNGAVEALQQAQQQAGGGGGEPGLYDSYRRELLDLNARRVSTAAPLQDSDSSNIMRIDHMFVSGFETTPYDQLIPQLQFPLDIPGQSATLNGYPNISLLLLVINQIGHLDTYINFLSNYAFTQVTPDVSQSFSDFYDDFSGQAFDSITFQLGQGVDVSPEWLADFGERMFGKKDDTASLEASVLYQHIQDIDFCNYIRNWFLNPKYSSIWQNASGGYIPFGYDATKELSFYNLTGVTYIPNLGSPASTVHTQLPYTNPTKTPLTFYNDSKSTMKSPWFPIFMYNQNKNPILVFLQLAGPYEIVIGPTWTILPCFEGQGSGAWTFDSMLTSSYFPTPAITGTALSNLFQDDNSFIHYNNINTLTTPLIMQGYSLYFPNARPDPKRDLKFEVLLIHNYGEYWPSFPGWQYPNPGYGSIPTCDAMQNDFRKYSYPGLGGLMAVKTATHEAVDLKQDIPIFQMSVSCGWCALLLPVNEQTCRSYFSSAPSYSNPLWAAQIAQSGSFAPAYNIAVLD